MDHPILYRKNLHSKELISSFLVLALLALAVIVVGEAKASRLTVTPDNSCFIPALYHDLLNRNPASGEVASGQDYLASHTRAQYAATLLAGTEYRIDLIQGWYRRFLGRPASNSDITFWLSYFGSGGTDEGVIANIVSSNEYFNLPRVGGTNSGYIIALYQDLLGRSPSTTELHSWLAAMGSGTTRLQVAQNILSSDEYRTDLIQSWYQKYLRRSASVSEVNTWLSVFSSGGTDEQIIATIVGLDEYFNRAGICTVFLSLIMRER